VSEIVRCAQIDGYGFKDEQGMTLDDAEQLARHLMKLHKLPKAWSFRFDSSKMRFGKCNYSKKEISLSRHLVELNNEAEVRDTILHEIAHVLAPRGTGHGPAWRGIAREIGCNGKRCFGDEVIRPLPRFRGRCPSCSKTIFRHRRTIIACASCTPVYDSRFAFVWSETSADA
jgi:predicted SprT family Zn-dependent metalloprotease